MALPGRCDGQVLAPHSGLEPGYPRDVTLTRAALFQALRKRNPGPGLVFHSDRGIEYAAHAYRAIMRRQGFTQSMNRPRSNE